MKVTITLNGTDVNPYLKMGFTRNPFPAIPRYEFSEANRMISELEVGPLKSVADIQRILKGCDQVFIDECCRRFKIGERVSFTIEFPE